MKFSFKNLGPLTQGELELNDLTIICGKNNTGKTYINYTVYGFFNTLYEILSETVSNLDLVYKNNSKYSIDLNYCYSLLNEIDLTVLNTFCISLSSRVFSTNSTLLNNASINYILDNKNYTKDVFINSFCLYLSKLLEKTKENLLFEINDNVITLLYDKESKSKVLNELLLKKVLITTIYLSYYSLNFSTYFLPAERSGLNLLFKELNLNRNDILYNLNHMSYKDIRNHICKYPLAIKNYLNFLNEEITNNTQCEHATNSFCSICDMLENDIVGGKYILTEDNTIKFQSNLLKENPFDFHLASSTARTLFGLDLFIKYKLKENDLLIIDEPELNLHPDNQRKLARILITLVNSGVKVLISTHSDYIIQEINNLIMLSRPFKKRKELMRKYNYTEDNIISSNRINAYISNNFTIEKAKIEIEGIIINTFDEVINSYNKSSDEIYYSYLEDKNL